MIKRIQRYLLYRRAKNMLPNLLDSYMRQEFKQMLLFEGQKAAKTEFFPIIALSPYSGMKTLKKLRTFSLHSLAHYSYSSLPIKVKTILSRGNHLGIYIHSYTVFLEDDQYGDMNLLIEYLDKNIDAQLSPYRFPIIEMFKDNFFWDDVKLRLRGNGYWIVMVCLNIPEENELSTDAAALLEDFFKTTKQLAKSMSGVFKEISDTFKDVKIVNMHGRGIVNYDYFLFKKKLLPEEIDELIKRITPNSVNNEKNLGSEYL